MSVRFRNDIAGCCRNLAFTPATTCSLNKPMLDVSASVTGVQPSGALPSDLPWLSGAAAGLAAAAAAAAVTAVVDAEVA